MSDMKVQAYIPQNSLHVHFLEYEVLLCGLWSKASVPRITRCPFEVLNQVNQVGCGYKMALTWSSPLYKVNNVMQFNC